MTTYTDAPTILVVEDNMPINRLFCKNLLAAGFNCKGVETVADAISFIQTQQPDLLILDFELPDGYGIHILDYIGKNNIQIPTIIASASTYALQLHHANYDIEHILVKPVSPRHLTSLVMEMLFLAKAV
ncbi:MAG: response regulator [Anaerolineae bacterium]|jgi:DNA-binding response OmpR family regulator|nr:response regulator [Anaerolineae bacterium]